MNGKTPTRRRSKSFSSAKAFEYPARNAGKNPKAIRLRAEPSGDGAHYPEIAVRAFRGSKAIADILVGLDSHGNLRVVCTANGEGDGDHSVALFPELPADEMVKRFACDLAAEIQPPNDQPNEHLKRSTAGRTAAMPKIHPALRKGASRRR